MQKLSVRLNYRITAQTHKRLMAVVEAEGFIKDGHITDGGFDQVLNRFLDRFELLSISTEQLFPLMGLTTEEVDYVFDTLEKTGANIAEELRTGFLARIKSLDRANDRLSMIDLENPEERQRRLGAGEKALEQIVAQLMAENDAATNNKDKVYLSSGLLKAVAHVGKTTAVDFLKNNRALVDTHHAQHGWYDAKAGQRHNQMVSRKFKALMCDEEYTNEQA